MLDLERNKKEFEELLNSVDRNGIENLIIFLREQSDFYSAPASARYHMNVKGGLCQHSLNVYHNLKKLNEIYGTNFDEESMIVAALLHDLAKIDYYEYYVQNRKQYTPHGKQFDDNGKFNWIQVGAYRVKDSTERNYVYSEHGVCSYLLASKYIKLTEDEGVAIINHHMDLDKNGYIRTDISEIYNRYPLASLLHIADCMATYLDENPYKVDE